MKVYLKLRQPRSSTIRYVLLGTVLLLLGILTAWSEVKRIELESVVAERGQKIWSAYTLLAAAESDYQTTQWLSSAHATEAISSLRRYVNGFPVFRSQEEYAQWRRLAALAARRQESAREAKSAPVDYELSEEVKAFRLSIEKTDLEEQARVAAEVARIRGSLAARSAFVLALGALACFVFWRWKRRRLSAALRPEV